MVSISTRALILQILPCGDVAQGWTAVNRGQFAVLPLRRDDYLAVSNINMHGIYLNTQLRTIYIDITIEERDKGKDM